VKWCGTSRDGKEDDPDPLARDGSGISVLSGERTLAQPTVLARD
jgi:hypothetical protein